MPDPRAACPTCRFWRQNGEGQYPSGKPYKFGICRRRAPRPSVSGPEGWSGAFAETNQDDWCGEHEPEGAL